MHDTLAVVLIMLTSSVALVALFRAFNLPSMLAYFMVGLILGPHATAVLPDLESSRHLAEFGIVFLMFSIGLEFSLPQLYAMRQKIFGLGGLQVSISLALAIMVCMTMGIAAKEAFIIGAALVMSSTAIVSKILAERVDLNSRHGRLSIAILLFQDIAVVPILVLIPALNAPPELLMTALGISALKATVVLSVIFVFGKPLMTPWFGIVARKRSRELFVMNVLMVTLLLSYATHLAGLSYALGAFVAGMLISETKYRYQVESDIAAFRDILLGLFFITVGMLLNVSVLLANIGDVIALLVAIILIKALVVGLLSRAFKYEAGVAIRTAIILAQAGEFGFVILALGLQENLISDANLQVVLAASLLSMMLAPFIIQYNGRLARYLSKSYTRNHESKLAQLQQAAMAHADHVIICGYGRSGQYLGRFLREEKVPYIALDIDPSRVQEAAAAGETVMYGDAGRRLVLEAAGAARAKAMVISYVDLASSIKILHLVHDFFPNLPVIVRTVDDANMDKLREAGATEVVPEALEGSLMLASHALVLLGVPLTRVIKRIRVFREQQYKMFKGFFHGISDTDEAVEKSLPRLHSVPINGFAFCVGKPLRDLHFGDIQVEVVAIRRNEHPVEPNLNFVFAEGDVLVLLAKSHDLILAEKLILSGKGA